MRFVSNMCWLKKGVGKTPTKIKLERDEMKRIFSDLGTSVEPEDEEEEEENEDVNQKEVDHQNEDSNHSDATSDSNKNTDKKYNLDDYDKEGYTEIAQNLRMIIIFD